MWHNERVIPHADCWVRDNLHSQMLLEKVHLTILAVTPHGRNGAQDIYRFISTKIT